ncbi:MAG: energy transducer TonB [Elusimicrobiota bacterium]
MGRISQLITTRYYPIVRYWLSVVNCSLLINFLLFLTLPYLTYIKPVILRKIYTVDLFRLPSTKSKEEKVVKKEKPPTPVHKLRSDTENINTQAKEETPQQEQEVCELGDLDTVPQILCMAKPKYPESLRVSGKEGRVVVKFLINYFGYVDKVVILEHGIDILFDQASIDAVKKWQFSPPKVKNRPASVWFVLPIKFELE